ncbi:MAG TPA: hypothetical protein VJ868_02170, partial [Actinomycetota bacterium]|nr:hypothetical protein [Actinomycetota bacterium]
MDLTGTLRRHPGRTAAVVVALLVLAVAGFLWFRPDRLVTDDPVSEAVPGAEMGGMGAGSADPAGASGPHVLAEGRFISLEHSTRGRAVILETADGRRFL